MLRGADAVDLEGFLQIYRDVRAGVLRFDAFAESMAAFEGFVAELE